MLIVGSTRWRSLLDLVEYRRASRRTTSAATHHRASVPPSGFEHAYACGSYLRLRPRDCFTADYPEPRSTV